MTHETQVHTKCTLESLRHDCRPSKTTGEIIHANSFVTLTYNDDSLPPNETLDISDWQNFAKRTRKKLGPFRFYHCGEYGGDAYGNPGAGRPHYHAILYGLDFTLDRRKWKRAKRQEGDQTNYLYRSEILDDLWSFGDTYIENVNYHACSYVAGYIMKKITSPPDDDTADKHYDGRIPEYSTMSRRPGIGSGWFEKYYREIYTQDHVVLSGKKLKIPPYYDSLLEELDPQMLEVIKSKRIAIANSPANKRNNTPERLKTREELAIMNDLTKKRDQLIGQNEMG